MSYIYVKIKTMTQAKTELFDAQLQRYAAFFKVLSHPARLAIIRYLAQCKTCISGDISTELPLGRTTVNQHLKELKKAGLIIGETEGVKVNYCLNAKKIDELDLCCNNFLKEIEMMKCC